MRTRLPYWLSVQIGDAVFAAEGSEDAVRSDFDRFMRVVESRSSSEGGAQSGRKSLFRVDEEGTLILSRPIPSLSPAEIVVVLVFGYATIQGNRWALATRLMKSAERSSLRIGRLHRVASGSEWLLKEGTRRSTRYSLTKQGWHRAQQIVRHARRGA